MALVRKTRQGGGQGFGNPGERLVGSRLPNKSGRQKVKKKKEIPGGKGGEDKEEKRERDLKTDAVLGCIRGYQGESEVGERDHRRAL